MTLLRVTGLRTEFRAAGGWHPAVDGIDFVLREGEILGLVGESGCGKSTVANSLMRLLPGTARICGGTAQFGEDDLLALDEARLRTLRGRAIGMIFQDPMTALDPVFRVGHQIEETLKQHLGLAPDAARTRAVDLLRSVGIPAPAERLRAWPHQLSGGMRQRVALAIAICCNPRLLIADEPTTALDVTIQAQVLELIRTLLVAERGAGVLLITHDLGVVARVCDRVAVMYAGRIVETGAVTDVFGAPRHPYTRALLRAAPTAEAPRGHLPTIPGRVPGLAARPPGCTFGPRCAHAKTICAGPDAAAPIPLGPDREVACVRHAAI
jgi:oligopeptide/dipeptide ABC transporter ATP-binding protein